MKPLYASADQESGSMIESVSGMSSMGFSRCKLDRDVFRGRFSREPVLVRLAEAGLDGSETSRDSHESSVLYLLRSRCVAFTSVPFGD
jgi:hypothetical protein